MRVRKAVLRIYYVVRFLLLPLLGTTQTGITNHKIKTGAEGKDDYKMIQKTVNGLPDRKE